MTFFFSRLKIFNFRYFHIGKNLNKPFLEHVFGWYHFNFKSSTGFFQTPKKLGIKESINPAILQIHSSEYKNVKSVREGKVLVVGSGQSGMKIAEELYKSGKKVFLAIGKTQRIPRSYRGKDLTY